MSQPRRRSLVHDYLYSDGDPSHKHTEQMLAGHEAKVAAHTLLLETLPDAYGAIDRWILAFLSTRDQNKFPNRPMVRSLKKPIRRSYIADIQPSTGEYIIGYPLSSGNGFVGFGAHNEPADLRSVSSIEIGYAPDGLTVMYGGSAVTLKYDDPALFQQLEEHFEACYLLRKVRQVALSILADSRLGLDFIVQCGAGQLDAVLQHLLDSATKLHEIYKAAGYRDDRDNEQMIATSPRNLLKQNSGR